MRILMLLIGSLYWLSAVSLERPETRQAGSGTRLEPSVIPPASAQPTPTAVDWVALNSSLMLASGAPAIPGSSNTYIANLEDSYDLSSVVTAGTAGNSPNYSVSGGCGSFSGSVFAPSSQTSCTITITTPGAGTNYLDSALMFDVSVQAALTSQTISMSVDATATTELYVNATEDFSVSGASTDVSYSVSDTAICTVSNSGTVTAVSAGTCTVSATAEKTLAYSAATATHSFTVNSLIAQTDATISTPNDDAQIAQNGSYSISVTGLTDNPTLTYSTSADAAVCSVDSSTGEITAGATAGSCPVTIVSAATSTYASSTFSQTFDVIAPLDQPDDFELSITSAVALGDSISLSTSGGLGGGSVSYSVTSGSCTVSDTTLTAPSSAGSCTVQATIAAGGLYTSGTASFTLEAKDPIIQWKGDSAGTLAAIDMVRLNYDTNVPSLDFYASVTNSPADLTPEIETFYEFVPPAGVGGSSPEKRMIYRRVAGEDEWIDSAHVLLEKKAGLGSNACLTHNGQVPGAGGSDLNSGLTKDVFRIFGDDTSDDPPALWDEAIPVQVKARARWDSDQDWVESTHEFDFSAHVYTYKGSNDTDGAKTASCSATQVALGKWSDGSTIAASRKSVKSGDFYMNELDSHCGSGKTGLAWHNATADFKKIWNGGALITSTHWRNKLGDLGGWVWNATDRSNTIGGAFVQTQTGNQKYMVLHQNSSSQSMKGLKPSGSSVTVGSSANPHPKISDGWGSSWHYVVCYTNLDSLTPPTIVNLERYTRVGSDTEYSFD